MLADRGQILKPLPFSRKFPGKKTLVAFDESLGKQRGLAGGVMHVRVLPDRVFLDYRRRMTP